MKRIAVVLLLSFSCAGVACSWASSENPAKDQPTIQDAGFESGKLAKDPISGWYSGDAAGGRIEASGDDKIKVQGDRSLRVVQHKPRPADQGLASVRQNIRMTDKLRESPRLEFEIVIRGKMTQPVKACVYVWDDDVAKPILEKDITVDPDWAKTVLSFEVPKNYDEFGVFFYLPSEEGVTLWLDDAQLRPATR
jgi:hypothetical protein